jgi:3-oxoacyl-[acyl-carrier protein] reductase
MVEQSSEFDLAGKTALVTGGSRGIGEAIVRSLAQEGVLVAIGYGQNRGRAQKLAAEVTAQGGKAIIAEADLVDPAAPAQLIAQVEADLGPVDILVNNAGQAQVQALEEVTAADFDKILAVNLRSPFLLSQRVLPGMRERGFGRILFISSMAAFTGGLVGPHYSSSKAALHGLTHYLAARTAADGITANTIAPGPIETDMYESLGLHKERLRRAIPMGRPGRPEEVADLALSMLRNPFLTSQIISLNGGMHSQ